MSWANLMCGKDPQVRALTLAFMNSLGAVTTTLIQQFLYPVTTAPEYKKGFRASLGACFFRSPLFVRARGEWGLAD